MHGTILLYTRPVRGFELGEVTLALMADINHDCIRELSQLLSSFMLLAQLSVKRAVSDWSKDVQAYHCSGSDTVVGSANVSSSIFAMLLVGWLVGMAMGAGLALYLRGRRSHQKGNKNLSPIASPAAAVSAC